MKKYSIVGLIIGLIITNAIKMTASETNIIRFDEKLAISIPSSSIVIRSNMATNCAIAGTLSCTVYDTYVTNYTRTPMIVGNKPTLCPLSNAFECLVYHTEPIYSDTDYYEIETVAKKTMINVDSYGKHCIKEEVVSERRRSVFQFKISITNEWKNTLYVFDWNSITNTLFSSNLVCISFTNLPSLFTITNTVRNFQKTKE